MINLIAKLIIQSTAEVFHCLNRYRSKGILFSGHVESMLDQISIGISLREKTNGNVKDLSLSEIVQFIPNGKYHANKNIFFTIESNEQSSIITLTDSVLKEQIVIQYFKYSDSTFECFDSSRNSFFRYSYSNKFMKFIVRDILFTRTSIFNMNENLAKGIMAINKTAQSMIKENKKLIHK